MKRVLISKNKFKFVNGLIIKPDAFHPLYDAWEWCNNMVHHWLMHSISPSITLNVDALELAFDVWHDLKERFSREDMVKVVELMKDFDAFTQGSLIVTEYL